MLPVLVLITLIMSLALLLLRRDMRSGLLFLAVSSITFFLYTISVYIAKKGGISDFTTLVLYGSNKVRQVQMYKVYTVNKLGFMMALGRYLSPYFLVLSSLNMAGELDRSNILKRGSILAIIPVLTIVLYVPQIFELFSSNSLIMETVVTFSKVWIIIYLAFAVFVMIHELWVTKLSFFKLRFIMKVMIIISLVMIYGIFFPQDPAQVYLFYRNEYMWMLGLWYLHKGFSSGFNYLVMIASLLAGILSMGSLIRYFSTTFGEEVVEVKVRRESHSAARGVSMFVHGTKNDLLSMKILLDKVQKNYPEDKDIERLLKINASLVERLEKLNKSLKVNAIKLYPISISEIMGICRQRVKENFSDYPVSVSGLDGSKLILADTTFLTEALYNIIQNGIEATKENKRNDPIEIEIEYGRMWAEITISDRGKGIDKALKKHIWEPFHSSKNSSTNWGIGMYFTRLVIKRHFGSISFMARKDGGTSFVVMLPLAGRGNDQSNVGRRQ